MEVGRPARQGKRKRSRFARLSTSTLVARLRGGFREPRLLRRAGCPSSIVRAWSTIPNLYPTPSPCYGCLVKWLYAVLIIALVVLVSSFARRRSQRAEAESKSCGSIMTSLGTAGKIWAQDNLGAFPADVMSMSNEVA